MGRADRRVVLLVRVLRQGDRTGRPGDGRRGVGGAAAVRLRLPPDRRRLPTGHRAARAVAEGEREIPRRAARAGGLHPAEGPQAGHLDQRRLRADGVRAAAQGVVRPRSCRRAGPGQLDQPRRGLDGSRRARHAGAAHLPRAARPGLGLLQARRAAPPALRRLQLVPGSPRGEGRAPVGCPSQVCRLRAGRDRARPLSAGVLGHPPRTGRPCGRLPHRHRRLFLRGSRAVQLVQQRGVAQRPRSHRAQRHRGMALDDGDVADGVDVPADRQARAVPHRRSWIRPGARRRCW